MEGGKAVCRVRGGVVLPFMDGATIYDAELFELMRNACDKRGIRGQTKTRVAGGTDAGRIHKSRAGVRVCAAAAPVRYIHSPSSVAASSRRAKRCFPPHAHFWKNSEGTTNEQDF